MAVSLRRTYYFSRIILILLIPHKVQTQNINIPNLYVAFPQKMEYVQTVLWHLCLLPNQCTFLGHVCLGTVSYIPY